MIKKWHSNIDTHYNTVCGNARYFISSCLKWRIYLHIPNIISNPLYWLVLLDRNIGRRKQKGEPGWVHRKFNEGEVLKLDRQGLQIYYNRVKKWRKNMLQFFWEQIRIESKNWEEMFCSPNKIRKLWSFYHDEISFSSITSLILLHSLRGN